jgi:hypothetical protein
MSSVNGDDAYDDVGNDPEVHTEVSLQARSQGSRSPQSVVCSIAIPIRGEPVEPRENLPRKREIMVAQGATLWTRTNTWNGALKKHYIDTLLQSVKGRTPSSPGLHPGLIDPHCWCSTKRNSPGPSIGGEGREE